MIFNKLLGFNKTVFSFYFISLLIIPRFLGAEDTDQERPTELIEIVSNEPASNLKLPLDITAQDLPNDEGDAVLIEWNVPKSDKERSGFQQFHILRSESSTERYQDVGDGMLMEERFIDYEARDGVSYHYKLKVIDGDRSLESDAIGPVFPRGSWFDIHRINALVFLLTFSFFIIFYINLAKQGKDLYIRRVSGLASVDEAVGRATEMGRKILYIPGIADISEIQTVAGLSILGHIAKTAVEYASRIIVPNMDPLTFAASREIVREAYLTAGRPEAFRDEDVYFITSEQFAYTAAVTGMMVREKPAANFFIGWFKAESLMLAETGQATGAIQIAGTAELDQLPFFVATCDYTLIGEELYAASAYLTRQPLLLGSIKGQDIAKACLIGLTVVGILALFFNQTFIRDFLTIQ